MLNRVDYRLPTTWFFPPDGDKKTSLYSEIFLATVLLIPYHEVSKTPL